MGLDESEFEKLTHAEWFEVPGYTTDPGSETARDRSTRHEAVEQAVEADLLILIGDARRESTFRDAAFAREWDTWFVEHPTLDVPPAFAVLTGLDAPHLGGDWKPPYDWENGQGPARPPRGRGSMPSDGVATQLQRGRSRSTRGNHAVRRVGGAAADPACAVPAPERSALIRHLHRASTRSKAGRLVAQVGEHGRWFWSQIRSRRQSKRET